MLPTNFISDLESAIRGRSNKTSEMLHQITDLFLLNAGHYSADQLSLYDGVLKRLVEKVDDVARAELARRLGPDDRAPVGVVRSLALDGNIEVAEPILTQSKALSDSVLSECIAGQSQKHLLAIATRDSLSEEVCDRLISKGDRGVLVTVANNPGAAISEPGFGALVEKSANDDWLSTCVGQRSDIPEHHLRELVSKATETVRQRLIAAHPHQRELLDGFLFPLSPSANHISKDYRAAEAAVKLQPVSEASVVEFAEAKRMDEVFVSIAQLSDLSPAEIERLLTDTWSSPVAVIMKAIGFHLSTLQTIYGARLLAGEKSQMDLVRTKAEFIALSRSTAERIMRFYGARRSTEITRRIHTART